MVIEVLIIEGITTKSVYWEYRQENSEREMNMSPISTMKGWTIWSVSLHSILLCNTIQQIIIIQLLSHVNSLLEGLFVEKRMKEYSHFVCYMRGTNSFQTSNTFSPLTNNTRCVLGLCLVIHYNCNDMPSLPSPAASLIATRSLKFHLFEHNYDITSHHIQFLFPNQSFLSLFQHPILINLLSKISVIAFLCIQ